MTSEDDIRSKLQDLARTIESQLPEDFGFSLLIASHGAGGTMLYVANVKRADAIQMMREWVAVQSEERNWGREMPKLELEEEFEAWWLNQQKRAITQDLRTHCRDAFVAGRSSA